MKKNKDKKEEMQKGKLGIYIAAWSTAAGVFAIMTYLQREVLSEFEKREVYVAAADIPVGTVINTENADDYLILKSVDAGSVPEECIDITAVSKGAAPVFDISRGTVISAGMLVSYSDRLSGMQDPVLAGFKADDLSRAVSGVLRAGDIIDIYSADKDTGAGKLLCGDVFVERGYDSSGNEVSDPETAVMFNIWLESSDVGAFYEGLMSGNLYVVRKGG